jgi:hypothetical protein
MLYKRRSRFLTFSDIFYPHFFRRFEESGVFQHPQGNFTLREMAAWVDESNRDITTAMLRPCSTADKLACSHISFKFGLNVSVKTSFPFC